MTVGSVPITEPCHEDDVDRTRSIPQPGRPALLGRAPAGVRQATTGDTATQGGCLVQTEAPAGPGRRSASERQWCRLLVIPFSQWVLLRRRNRWVWSLGPRTASPPGPLAHTGTTAPVCCWLGGGVTGPCPRRRIRRCRRSA